MPIEFHCSHCGKKIKAPDEHAGKRGKCPSCKNSVYIPTPDEDIEPLRLSPVDEQDEQQREKLMEESRNVARTLRGEGDDLPAEDTRPQTPSPMPEGDARLPTDVETLVNEYLLAMHEGELDEAEELATEIRRDFSRAEQYLERIAMDEVPPKAIASIPRPILNGFIKQLREST